MLIISDYPANGLSDNPTEKSDNPHPPNFKDTISASASAGFLKVHTISSFQTVSEQIGSDNIRSFSPLRLTGCQDVYGLVTARKMNELIPSWSLFVVG